MTTPERIVQKLWGFPSWTSPVRVRSAALKDVHRRQRIESPEASASGLFSFPGVIGRSSAPAGQPPATIARFS
jgi:hypothetical protein